MSKIPIPINGELTTSFNKAQFPIDAFIALQKQNMGHTIKPEQICTENTIKFGKPYESVLAYTKKEGEQIHGTSYLWARNLTHADTDFIYIPTEEGLILSPIKNVLAANFAHKGKPIYELEFGGSFVEPEQRGKGIFSDLFSARMKTVAEIQNGSFKLQDDEMPISNDDLFITLTAKGNYSDSEALIDLKKTMQNGYISFDALTQMGIPYEMIGMARPESAASTHKAQAIKMQLIGFSSNNLGPVYALPISIFSK